jgi:DNA-binding CsgD family transcriptional regulator
MPAAFTYLTERQIRCLSLAAQGLQMDQIAARIYVTAWSVKNDLIRVREALRARNTAHAVALAIGTGLIPPGPPRRLAPSRHPHARPTGTGWPA